MINNFNQEDGWEPGRQVRVLDGPFKDCVGLIDGVDSKRERVRVIVQFFWRDTPAEFDYDQVRPIT